LALKQVFHFDMVKVGVKLKFAQEYPPTVTERRPRLDNARTVFGSCGGKLNLKLPGFAALL
jgi:hypothetical protein